MTDEGTDAAKQRLAKDWNQRLVKDWNNNYPTGTAVTVTLDEGETVKAETRSEAWIYGDDAVILLKSDEHHFSGCWLLDRVQVRPDLDDLPTRDEIRRLRETKDEVYKERDMCVALIARLADALGFRVGLRRHEGEWEDDWRNIVMIELPKPNGQISWHVHDSEMEWFAWMKPYPDEWDGHDSKEKYRRVLNYFAGYVTHKIKTEYREAITKCVKILDADPNEARGLLELIDDIETDLNAEYERAEHAEKRLEEIRLKLKLRERRERRATFPRDAAELDRAAQHDPVNHPSHYNTGRFEVIDVIEDWALGFCLGNAVKYIARAGKKDAARLVEDLSKAAWYLDREIKRCAAPLFPDAHDSIVFEFARTVAENRRLQEQVTELQTKMTEMREESRR